MTEQLYLHDSYAKEMDAVVEEVIDVRFVVLDKSVFYPQGGGQPTDTGTLTCNGKAYSVVAVTKKNGKQLHEVSEPGLAVGNHVHGIIDWERRYALMRYHTAAHILSSVVHEHAGALISGNQIATDKLRIDFSIEQYDPNQIQHYVDEANRLIAKHVDVYTKFLPREEALKLPGVVKLASVLPPNIPELRIVSIGSGDDLIDEQADGGTHVNNTREIGKLKLVGVDNKGKNNRRITVVFDG
jgi:misacylated tRNA(Ala) deacylase